MDLTTRQRQIVEAALDIVAADGIQALTVKNISQRVGFRESAIYRHFRNKTAILYAIADIFERHSETTLETISHTDLPALEKIKAFFLDRCRTFASDKTVTTVMFSDEIFREVPELSAKIMAIIDTHQRFLVQIIRQGQRAGEVIGLQPMHLFMIIMGPLRLLVTQWQASGYGFDLLAEGQRVWASIAAVIARPAPEGE